MVAKNVPGKTDSRTQARGITVLIGGIASGATQSGNIEFLRAGSINKWILAAVSLRGIEVPNVATLVIEGAQDLST